MDRAMDLDAYNAFCGSLTATSHVVQWGDAHVWKVGGKVFALGRWSDDDGLAVSFKTSRLDFTVLTAMPGLRPAPYLASRGLSWVQHYGEPGLEDEDLCEQITESYLLVAEGLSRKRRRELGIDITR